MGLRDGKRQVTIFMRHRKTLKTKFNFLETGSNRVNPSIIQMKTYDGKSITKKCIKDTIRTQDHTRIFSLYHHIYGGKVVDDRTKVRIS